VSRRALALLSRPLGPIKGEMKLSQASVHGHLTRGSALWHRPAGRTEGTFAHPGSRQTQRYCTASRRVRNGTFRLKYMFGARTNHFPGSQ
jgi:hypothetical protein